jgi:Fe2+ or Zn2+ uptake regulation protein
MSETKEKTDFDRLGIDINSTQMAMLKAIMAAAGGPSKPVNYKEIDEQFEKIQGKKYSRAYIYRQLKQLEDEGYITIEQELGQARGYQILESEIIKMLIRKKEEASSELLKRKQDLTQKLQTLQNVNTESTSFLLYNQLMGLSPVTEDIAIEGIENVRNTVVREFGTAAKPGDEIRVIAPASLLGPGKLEQAGMAEMSLLARAKDGVKILTVMVPSEGTSSPTGLFKEFLKNVGSAFTNLAGSGNISLKVAKKHVKTYRMVSLNREKMLLYLTHTPESDMAVLVHRKDNPGLIDDAVDTFDRIARISINVVEIVRQMLSEDKES